MSLLLVLMLARFAAMSADCVTSEDCRLVMSADCVASEDCKLAMSGKISHNCSDFGAKPKALGPSIKEVSNLKEGGWGQNFLCNSNKSLIGVTVS